MDGLFLEIKKVIRIVFGFPLIWVVGLVFVGILLLGIKAVIGILFTIWMMLFGLVFISTPEALGVSPYLLLAILLIAGSAIAAMVNISIEKRRDQRINAGSVDDDNANDHPKLNNPESRKLNEHSSYERSNIESSSTSSLKQESVGSVRLKSSKLLETYRGYEIFEEATELNRRSYRVNQSTHKSVMQARHWIDLRE